MLGERLSKDNLERSVNILKYIESYSELSKRISEIEEKSSYDLFVKLYGSNISLKNELEQINSRYSKLYELAFEKSEYVEQLYNIRKLLNKPEIKILMLLSRLDSSFSQSSIEQVLMVASNNKYSKVDDIYFDYNSLIEVINKDRMITKNNSSHPIYPYNIRERNALITWVNGFRLIIVPSTPSISFAGNRAVLKKNTGKTMAFITVS